jgi:hypothetical protein
MTAINEMTAIIVGLCALAIAVAIQGFMLRRHARGLKAREQAFRFHAIRDELQLLAIREEVDPNTDLYQFLMYTANLAIQNAGVMRLRDILALARRVKQEIPQQFLRALETAPKPLRKLTAETFGALASMLVANDPLVAMGLSAAALTAKAWSFIRPLLRSVISAIDALAKQIAPSHAEAVRYARDYSNIAGRFAL